MRLTISHTTRYSYEQPPKQLIQLLRLTPRADAHQRVLEWSIRTPGRLSAHRDSYGNATHTHVLSGAQAQFEVSVKGVVDIGPLADGCLPVDEDALAIPPLAYLVPTPLTAGFVAMDALARGAAPQAQLTGQAARQALLYLAARICDALPYQPGATDATTSAETAFAAGAGVCQDHAHAMIAACRVLGWPARYVSGYVDPGHSRAAASHAWVDVFLAEGAGQWVSVDVTNDCFASDAHCRLAVGRDYLDACPVRGVREGGHTEQMDVLVQVLTQQ